MKRTTRWTLLGIVIIGLLVALMLASRFVLLNFTGTGPMPIRSAFSGRLPWKPDGDLRRFQFFYATNRADNAETFNGQGNEISDKITAGTFDVLISPYMTVEPFVWFDKETMKWADRNVLSDERFRSQLHDAVQASPNKSLLIIVWGFRDWFQSAALKTAYTAYVLDINTPVLLFDWPGNQGEGPRGYAASQAVTAQSGRDLGRLLANVVKDTDANHVWLMGSSLGCQTICDGLYWLSQQPDLFKGKPKLSHVVLSAPDVLADAFDDKFSATIQKVSEHLTAYVSSNDRALLMSHWLNRGRRLGRKAQVLTPPEERFSEYEFEEASELLELQEKGAREISIVDATPINVIRNLHHFFTDSPVFFDDLYQRLLQPEDIVSRRLHTVRTRSEGGVTYSILWND